MATATESVMAAAMEAMEAMVAPMVFLLTEDTVATDVATMARGKLRLFLKLRLLTDTAMAAAMEAMEAMVVPMEDTVATGLMAAMVALTGMATESRQQPEHQHLMKTPYCSI